MEELEKSVQKFRCRACWEEKTNDVLILVTTLWSSGSEKTIKDIILFCVPTLSIQDTSHLCRSCLWQLKFTYHFIERCLKTESILVKETTNIIQNLNLYANRSRKLENVLGQSFEEGNKIQIIFGNPPLLVVDSGDEDGDGDILNVESVENHDHTYFNSANEKRAEKTSSKETSPVDKVVKQVPEIEANLNILNEDDSDNDDNDDWFNKAFADITEDNVDKKKDRRKGKTSEKQPSAPVTKEASEFPYPPELLELLDIAPLNLRCVTVETEMSEEQRNDMLRDGINVLNMSTDPTKKNRVLYLSRDFLMATDISCRKCKISFNTSCDYADHKLQHERGNIVVPHETKFFCNLCSAKFRCNSHYRSHYRAKHGLGSPHQCPKCSKRFRNPKDLERHQEFFKDKEKCLVSCSKCSKTFTSTRLLENHEADVADAPCCDYSKCNVCSQKFTKEGFIEHCKEHTNFLCSECGKSYYTNMSLINHRYHSHSATSTHNTVGAHMCHKCGQVMKSAKTLRHHLDAVHGNNVYMCDKCPRQFKSKLYLLKHSKIHMAERSKIIHCTVCGKGFNRSTSLKQHVQTVHVANRKYVCPTCGAAFVRKDYLQSHMSSHMKNMGNSCPVCNRSFASEARLARHTSSGHDENGKSLERRHTAKEWKAYKLHIDPCVCNICNKVLACPSTLRLHYKSHLKIRQFKCDKCEVTFQTYNSIKNHMKRHEHPNFDFSCNICHAYKSSQLELKEHMRERHKNLKYKCTYCPKKFGRKYLLYSHESMQHKDEYAKKEDLYNILAKQAAVKAPKSSWTNKRKGVKIGAFDDGDVHQVLDKLAKTNPETLERVKIDFDSAHLGRIKVDVMEQPTRFETNFDILSEEFQMRETDRACKSLQENMDYDELDE